MTAFLYMIQVRFYKKTLAGLCGMKKGCARRGAKEIAPQRGKAAKCLWRTDAFKYIMGRMERLGGEALQDTKSLP